MKHRLTNLAARALWAAVFLGWRVAAAMEPTPETESEFP